MKSPAFGHREQAITASWVAKNEVTLRAVFGMTMEIGLVRIG